MVLPEIIPQVQRIEYASNGETAPFDVFRTYSSVDRATMEKIGHELHDAIQKRGSPNTPFRVADIGAGRGRSVRKYLHELRERGVTAPVIFDWFEPDNENVTDLGQVANSLESPFFAQVINTDLENADLGEEQYDFLIFSQVLYHIDPKDHLKAFQKMLRSLKRGGTLIVVVRDEDEDYNFLEKFYEKVTKLPFQEITIKHAQHTLDELPERDQLTVTQAMRVSYIPFPFLTNRKDCEKLITFYMRKPWKDIEPELQSEIEAYLTHPERDGKLRQQDGIIIIRKNEVTQKSLSDSPHKNEVIFEQEI